jgi:hypothetical protein
MHACHWHNGNPLERRPKSLAILVRILVYNTMYIQRCRPIIVVGLIATRFAAVQGEQTVTRRYSCDTP